MEVSSTVLLIGLTNSGKTSIIKSLMNDQE